MRKQCRETICGADVKIIAFHVSQYYGLLEDFTRRLYAQNPCYEPDMERRKRNIEFIFHDGNATYPEFKGQASHRLLTEAFASAPPVKDRVFILCLGLKKGIDEAYSTGGRPFLTGCQIDGERLKRLYSNLAQVDWRLKTYRDKSGRLLFITNKAGENGYINMGFEVIMTKIMTRVEDDIYLRGGLEKNLAFRLSTVFISII